MIDGVGQTAVSDGRNGDEHDHAEHEQRAPGDRAACPHERPHLTDIGRGTAFLQTPYA